MKKIYKIKSLAVVACALMANVAFGQNLKVTSNGNPVAENDVIELSYEFEDLSGPDFIYYEYAWNPHIEVSSTEDDVPLTVTVSAGEGTQGFQICWPMQCQFLSPAQTLTVDGKIGVNPSDLQIHRGLVFNSNDVVINPGELKVKLESGSNSMEFTIKCLASDINAVEENLAVSDEGVAYYTLEGIKVEKPSKGLYIIKQGNKSKLIYRK